MNIYCHCCPKRFSSITNFIDFTGLKRYHRTMKNRILLEHYYSPEELERALGEFIDFYNNNRLHESLNNLAPADVYFNRGAKILQQREEIKHKTILQRRINHLLQIQNQSLSFV